MPKKIVIIGGGAAGYFLAANLDTHAEVLLLERASHPLQKVKISGGGRCNLTHACFDPAELVQYYPRGEKELRSVFHKFQPGDTMQWFEERGLQLKIEEDQRVFPITDRSQSVIDILEREAAKNAQIIFNCGVEHIEPKDGKFFLSTSKHEIIEADAVVVCTGSSKNFWKLLQNLGHEIVPPLPSLFTFNIPNEELNALSGISFPQAELSIPKLRLVETGPLLITHWGLSGPAVLKLSAYGARELASVNYEFDLVVNWVSSHEEACLATLLEIKQSQPQALVQNAPPFDLSKRFWNYIINNQSLGGKRWQELSVQDLRALATILCGQALRVKGKSTFKEEFVTAGGIDLKEIDFRNMQSKIHDGLFFAGEVLDIDAITGGFNFQACWSEAWLIAHHFNYF